MVLLDLALSWGRIGLFGFGGGSAMVPLMKAECVDGRAWLSEEQFLDMLATGYALPGPIAAKMSVSVGFEAGGIPGAAVSFAAVMAPAALLMLGLAAMITRYRETPAVSGAMRAVKPVVVALLAWTALDLAPTGIQGWQTGVLAAAALAALLLKIHPAVVLLAAMVLGATLLR
jgi:chromate transporter